MIHGLVIYDQGTALNTEALCVSKGINVSFDSITVISLEQLTQISLRPNFKHNNN